MVRNGRISLHVFCLLYQYITRGEYCWQLREGYGTACRGTFHNVASFVGSGRIFGNEFAYCSRMRPSDYLSLFTEAGFDVCQCETKMDNEAQKSLKDGFMVNEKLQDHIVDDLCVTQVRVALKKSRKLAGI